MTFDMDNSIPFEFVLNDYKQEHKGVYLPDIKIFDGPSRTVIHNQIYYLFRNIFSFKIDFGEGEVKQDVKVLKSMRFFESAIHEDYDPSLMPKQKKSPNLVIPTPDVLVLSFEQYDAYVAYVFYCPYLLCGYVHSIISEEE